MEIIDNINRLLGDDLKRTIAPGEVTDAARKEKREFHIPKAGRERGFYGSEFEVQLKNKLTRRSIAKECADWMRKKAIFKLMSPATEIKTI